MAVLESFRKVLSFFVSEKVRTLNFCHFCNACDYSLYKMIYIDQFQLLTCQVARSVGGDISWWR